MDVNAGSRREAEGSAGSGGSGLVAAYGGGSDTDEEIDDVHQEEKQHVDWSKLVCLLCKRQFPTGDALNRYVICIFITLHDLRGMKPTLTMMGQMLYRVFQY